MTFDVGALVRARGREWVVLPESREDPDILVLRPLGGTDDEIAGIYRPLEAVTPAEFKLPDPETDLGNHLSCRLLRDAARLSIRSGAGPFRCLARIAVTPRPYQLVPLLMALKLDPIRLLIADDVGVGKTVEACLIARELLDRGEIRGLVVLSPPHLAEQWQRALREQFHIDAERVLPGTAARLERQCNQSTSLFERYPFTVVSTDYIKSDRRRHEFLRTCPELVIVDEAHTCTAGTGRIGQKRHDLLRALVEGPNATSRHLILVTATPHSGNEDTFRSLLALLDPHFGDLPQDLSGDSNRSLRQALARHFVQRRRADLKAYLDTITPFPDRTVTEEHYTLKPAYRAFLYRVLAYCRETVLDKTVEVRRQRVRWWSALALLRALASSPAAAAATLRNRSATVEGETVDQVDAEGRRAVLDLDEAAAEGVDVIPGSDPDPEDGTNRRRLLRLAREADALAVHQDAKLLKAERLVRKLLEDGYAPILFCRFIPTVTYVADFLRKMLEKDGVTIEAVSGLLPPEERERRVEALGQASKRVLVCTDCLSEGINLQAHFNAVVHYDLSWNPTRHEQREGRVDRFGQRHPTVRTLTYYGQDNPVDGIVLDVLLRKHQTIRQQLGILVPVPMDAQVVEDAMMEGLLIRPRKDVGQLEFGFLRQRRRVADLHWDAAAAREKRSRTLFAQNQLLKAVNLEVRKELEAVRKAIGGTPDVRWFVRTALQTSGAAVSGDDPVSVEVRGCPTSLKDALGQEDRFVARFSDGFDRDAIHLTRTHPITEALASHVLETALDPHTPGPGRRCGVIRTRSVTRKTTVLLLRLRCHILSQARDGTEHPLLAEEQVLAGFTGTPDDPQWLPEADLEPLLAARPDANVGPDQARTLLQRLLDRFSGLKPHLDQIGDHHGATLLDAHRRVRKAARVGVRTLRVDVHKPVDVLGIFVYLPVIQGGSA